jgi:LysM repeat protein
MLSSLIRLGLAAFAGIMLLGLSACSGGGGAASVSTVQIRPSSYEVKEAATTTTVPTSAAAGPDGRSAAEQTYIVQSSNDVPYNIAKKFDVDLDALRNYNGWAEGTYAGFPGPGGTVRIPPGAKFIDPSATTTTAASASGGGTDTAASAPTGSAGGDRCNPTYTIESGDAPLVITRKFDITLDQLNAVNASTPNWPNLYTGRVIKLPPPADCAGAVTTTTAAG